MRPIISTIGCYNYNLAKNFGSILHAHILLKYREIVDSFRLSEQIRDTANAAEMKMIGLAIENLYPSIPIEDGLKIAPQLLKENELSSMKIENIVRLLRFCTKDDV